jgi:hypothetical protein
MNTDGSCRPEISPKIDHILDILMSERSSGVSSSAMWARHHTVPSLLSAAFIGREGELRWLETTLEPEMEKLVGRRAGIYGITGIGKTQLASESKLNTLPLAEPF